MRTYLAARIIPEPNSGCWLWTGALQSAGYGHFKNGDHYKLAHRASYEEHRGAIPFGMVLDHLCRTPSCCNPDHLEAVTQAENLRRYTRTITKCRHGHELTPENIYRRPDKGTRGCRTCRRLAVSAHWQIQKAINAEKRRLQTRPPKILSEAHKTAIGAANKKRWAARKTERLALTHRNERGQFA